MEQQIVTTLEFRLNPPSPLDVIRHISKVDDYDVPTRTVAKYIQEVSIPYHEFLAYRPSTVAAACMLLARNILSKTNGRLRIKRRRVG